VTQTFYVSLVVLGLLLGGYGVGLLLTGRNIGSGRGLLKADTARLQRAPAIYFRAIGAVMTTAGLALLNYGVIEGFRSGLAGGVVTALEIVEIVLYLAVVISLLWLLRLASRYKLFRWNKP
jgi:hypothetical protein